MSGSKFVLVVEDDDEIRSMIVSSLKAECGDLSLIVVEARDGREAIQFAGRQEFHCVVTDLNMPKTSGQELIKALLANSLNANTPTVVVSAGIDDSFLESFKNVRTIAKPFDPQSLSLMVLREIKLGRIDERIPAHLLNFVVETIRDLLVNEMMVRPESIQAQTPVIRKSGDHLEGIMHVALTLTTGMTQAKLGLSFEREFLIQMMNDYFLTRRSPAAAMGLELAARQTAQLIIERMSSGLSAVFGSVPRVAEIKVYDLQDSAVFQEAAKLASITLAISTDQGRVFVSALAPSRAKRGQT